MSHITLPVLLLLLLLPTTLSLPLPTFETWKQLYNKTYESEKEETLRRLIFEDNRQYVAEYGDKDSSLQLELGRFADLTHEEFLGAVEVAPGRKDTRSKFGGKLFAAEMGEEGTMTCELWTPNGSAAPSSIDWKTKGAVTGILMQTRQCPMNSYAIAALGAVTGQWYQKSGRRIAFSEQQVVDCSRRSGNFGCIYGTVGSTYGYIQGNGGIATRVNYPTTGPEGHCRTAVKLGPTVTGCRTVARGDEKAMKELVGMVGPVTAMLDISPRSIQFYRSGVYYEKFCHSPYASHHVLVTGYGTQYDRGLDRTVDYWLVKNSWGTGWGENGYMKIIRNYHNHCGIANSITVPYVDK
ncbi:hypothetical protein ACHWQZ_G004657 [Mnemiopsis leidyi]